MRYGPKDKSIHFYVFDYDQYTFLAMEFPVRGMTTFCMDVKGLIRIYYNHNRGDHIDPSVRAYTPNSYDVIWMLEALHNYQSRCAPGECSTTKEAINLLTEAFT